MQHEHGQLSVRFSSSGYRRFDMKLETAAFVRLRRLAPVLDDVLNAGEVEHADQAMSLALLAQLCSQLFEAYHCRYPGDIAQVQLTNCTSRGVTRSSTETCAPWAD
jgi:hypothetical protein